MIEDVNRRLGEWERTYLGNVVGLGLGVRNLLRPISQVVFASVGRHR